MNQEKSINNLSIVAFILSFILFPVGLILSIIGIVRCKNFEKNEGIKPKYKVFNYVGLAVSILNIIITCFTIFIILLALGITTGKDDEVLGRYTCNDGYYRYKPVVAEFKNGKFTWGLYNDITNNSVNGTYRITSRKIYNKEYTYKLTLKPSNYSISNKNTIINTNKPYYITIIKNGESAIISFGNGSTYKCYKSTGSNNEL